MVKLKNLLPLIIIFSFLNSFAAYSNEKVVFIDVDYIIKNSVLGKKVLKSINDLDQQNIKKLNSRSKELKDKEIELKSKQNIISEDAFKKEFSELKKKVSIYTQEKNKMIKDLKKFKNDELDKVFQKIGPIVSKYMELNSIDIVLDSKNMFMGNSQIDITEDILNEINKQYN